MAGEREARDVVDDDEALQQQAAHEEVEEVRRAGAAAVVLAVHRGRIYVLASLTASATRGASRRAFSEFLAAFRFVEPTVTP